MNMLWKGKGLHVLQIILEDYPAVFILEFSLTFKADFFTFQGGRVTSAAIATPVRAATSQRKQPRCTPQPKSVTYTPTKSPESKKVKREVCKPECVCWDWLDLKVRYASSTSTVLFWKHSFEAISSPKRFNTGRLIPRRSPVLWLCAGECRGASSKACARVCWFWQLDLRSGQLGGIYIYLCVTSWSVYHRIFYTYCTLNVCSLYWGTSRDVFPHIMCSSMFYSGRLLRSCSAYCVAKLMLHDYVAIGFSVEHLRGAPRLWDGHQVRHAFGRIHIW